MVLQARLGGGKMKDLNMGLESRGDLMRKLDDDTAMHLLQYLDTTKDIASASSVCRSWRSFGLWC